MGSTDFFCSFFDNPFRLESTKGTYAKEWAKWEKQLREVLLANAEYLNSVQVIINFLS